MQVDFLSQFGYHKNKNMFCRSAMRDRKGSLAMKKSTGKLIALISVILGVVAVVTTLTTVLIYFDKKKDDKELERYLDDSIQ